MDRFERAMKILAVHEGGYVNHPDDPGGATNKGVTQATYDSYRLRRGLALKSVRHIGDDEVYEIYRRQYWDSIHADDLPEGVAYCVFDASVNSGPARAAKWLQVEVGAQVDGIVGNETLGLVEAQNRGVLIDRFCDRRLAFMRRLRHWKTFKNGWSKRVREVRAQSKIWAGGAKPRPSVVQPQAKASGPERAVATARDVFSDRGALGAIGGILGSVGALINGDGPVQYALAAVLVIAALAGVWWMLREQSE